jgi:HipA-like protein
MMRPAQKQSMKGMIHRILESWGISVRPAPAADTGLTLVLYLPVDDETVKVGILRHERGEYVFSYAPEYKDHPQLPPLASFPDLNREYRSSHLWPFFEVRMPVKNRPDVAQVIRARGLENADPLRLLGELSKRSVSSPYVFQLQDSPT